jgi:hypothetical protein
MYSSKKLVAFTLTWILAMTQAADLSYNGLAITPQMGWVRQLSPSTRPFADQVDLRIIGTPMLVM